MVPQEEVNAFPLTLQMGHQVLWEPRLAPCHSWALHPSPISHSMLYVPAVHWYLVLCDFLMAPVVKQYLLTWPSPVS